MGRIADFFLGKDFDPVGPEPDPPPMDRYALQPVIVDGLLTWTGGLDYKNASLPTLFRGVQVITDVCGMLPFQAVRGGIDTDQARLADPEVVDPQPIVTVNPSPFMTRDQFIRQTVSSLVWRGNAYWWMTGHDLNGRPTIVTPIDPDEVSCTWATNTDGHPLAKLNREYEWRGQKMTEGVDLLHIYLEPLPGEPTGLSPIWAGNRTLGYAAEADAFSGRFFGESATPAGVINHPGRLDFTEAETLRTQWETQHNGGRGTAVLAGGITYSPISITPEQAQFLATRAFSNQQIATMLGIPQHILNAGQPAGTASSLTYANLSMILDELMRLTLAPVYLKRIESAFTRLLPRGQSVRFSTSEFLRTDDASRWAAQKTALDAKILTQNEVRQLEGRPPVEGGDEFPEAPSMVPGQNPFDETEPEPEPEMETADDA